MKTKSITLALFLIGRQFGYSQDFANLDFEAANVSGFSTDDKFRLPMLFPTRLHFSFSTLPPISLRLSTTMPYLRFTTISVVDGNPAAAFAHFKEIIRLCLWLIWLFCGHEPDRFGPIGAQSIQMDYIDFLGLM